MSQTQFLLFLISIIPLANCLLIKVFEGSQALVNLVSKSLPILFFMNLVGLLSADNASLLFFESSKIFSFGFAIDKMVLIFLFLLNLIWVVFSFYSDRFLSLSESKNSGDFKLFFAAIIAVVSLILISRNLLTILFFYNALLFLSYFFAVKFLYKEKLKLNYFLTFLLYLEAVFLFFAAVLTYKFAGKIDFISEMAIAETLDKSKQIAMLVLYLGSLFLLFLMPSYLLYRKINFDSLEIYAMFFLGIAFSSLYIFIKILIFVFGFSAFSEIISEIGFSYFEWVFLFNLLISSALLLFSKNLKSVFFYLFFNQFIFTLFAIFIFAAFDGRKVLLPLISFSLSITLIFLCLSNFILYLSKAEFKSLKSLFYDLKITSSLLIFAILNLSGIVPALGMFEKFFIIKVLFQKELFLSGIIFVLNTVTSVAFACKMIYSLLARVENKRSSKDLGLIKTIDYDSNLMLTALVVALIIFLLPIAFQLKNSLFVL